MGSEALSSPGTRFTLFVYLIECTTAVILAIGALVLEKRAYEQDCNLGYVCSSFSYTLPAIATAVSIITFTQALIQLQLYYTRKLTGIMLFKLSSIAAILWLIVIVVGWSPLNVSYEYSTGNYNLGITGWFLAVQEAHNQYDAYKNHGLSLTQAETNTIGFCFGLLVISCMMFPVTIIIALSGLIIHKRGETPIYSNAPTTGNTSTGPWVRPPVEQK